MVRHSKLGNKKKAIPSCFKRNRPSSQFLAAANYKLQIKKLKKANRELACALQETKCRAAEQEKALAECNQKITQMVFVKMKLTGALETVQKLVADLGEMYDVVDGKPFDFLKNSTVSHQEARLMIRNPSISTIEESAFTSTIEPNLEEHSGIENSAEPTRIDLPTAFRFFDADSSQTELYNVPLVLATEENTKKSNENQNDIVRSSTRLSSCPATPVWIPILPPLSTGLNQQNSISPQASTETQKTVEQSELQNLTSSTLTKNEVKLTTSKIPVKKTGLTKINFPLLDDISSQLNKRKTFIVKEPFLPLPVPDRRGTFVINSLSKDNRADATLDQRDTFVVTKPDTVCDQAYFSPSESAKGYGLPSPIAPETQNSAPNQTVLLSEDMELTEIIPVNNQLYQFIPTKPPPKVAQFEDEEGDLSKKLPTSIKNQTKHSESFTTHAVIADPQTQSVKKAADISLASNLDVDPAGLLLQCNKEEISIGKINLNIKHPAELPSPISHFSETSLSVQDKILSTIKPKSEKNKLTSESAVLVETNIHKKSTISKDSSKTKLDTDKIPLEKKVDSPNIGRSSNKMSEVFFTDSDVSEDDFDPDFIPGKRFSLLPGRKIMNPNNKKVFMFTKYSTKQNAKEDTITDSCTAKPLEGDVFNFSASSEAGKSPTRKSKKRKSVKPKSKSKKKIEVNHPEVALAAQPRKSILCLNRENDSLSLAQVLQSNRKSVRFTLVKDVPQVEKIDGTSELNVAYQNPNDLNDPEKESSGTSQAKRFSVKKKGSSTRSSSLKATGVISKRTSSRLSKSGKRLSCNLSDSPEDIFEPNCSPTKKMPSLSCEIPPQIEEHTDLSSKKEDRNARIKSSEGLSGTTSSQILGENSIHAKKEKKCSEILSEVNPNLDVNTKVTESCGVQGRRPFSGVSERRSGKKESIVDDLFLDLDIAVSDIADKEKDAINLLQDEKIVSNYVKARTSIETERIKMNSPNRKISKPKSGCGKKESSKKKKMAPVEKDKENLKLDVLTSENNLYEVMASKESIEKLMKPKRSRRKKEYETLLQNDLKIDNLNSENPVGFSDAVHGRSRKNRSAISYKEPSLNVKMRRQ